MNVLIEFRRYFGLIFRPDPNALITVQPVLSWWHRWPEKRFRTRRRPKFWRQNFCCRDLASMTYDRERVRVRASACACVQVQVRASACDSEREKELGGPTISFRQTAGRWIAGGEERKNFFPQPGGGKKLQKWRQDGFSSNHAT